MFTVRLDGRACVNSLTRLSRDFEPAVIKAVNSTVFKTMKASRMQLEHRFDLRNTFVQRGFAYKKASLSRPVAFLMHRDPFMSKQEYGESHLTKAGHRVTLPTEAVLKPTQARVRTRDYANRLLASNGKSKQGIRYRNLKKGQKFAGKTLKHDMIIKVRRKKSAVRKQAETMYVLKQSVNVPMRWHWRKFVDAKARATFPKAFSKHYNNILNRGGRYR